MNTTVKDRYLKDSLTTATPATLLVRLYDRLVLDLEGAEQAIEAGAVPRANELLCHAQDIVAELHATLDVDSWAGGPGLAQVYEFALQELIGANVAKDAARVTSVRELFGPLRDAWREAALQAETATSLSA